MNAVFFLLFFITTQCFSQGFGKSNFLIYPTPASESDMEFYNWYKHPKEPNIFIVNFERTEYGFYKAFDEVICILFDNEIAFENYLADSSSFEFGPNNLTNRIDLYHTITTKKGTIFRTWKAENDFLTLLVCHEVFIIMLGEGDAHSAN